jgi:hypothetical protein
MKLNEKMSITKRSVDGAFYGERNGQSYLIEKGHEDYDLYNGFYDIMRAAAYVDRPKLLKELIANNRYPAIFAGLDDTSSAPSEKPDPKKVLLTGIQKLMDFFTEFSFVPSFRFTNTFAFMACKNANAAKEYVRNYFALMDSSYVKEVGQKLSSTEFMDIIQKIAQYGEPTSHINTRFKVYFGSAGTGKTTIAQTEADNRCIVCNSSMLPSDLMEDFIFKDGNPDFNPSLLWDCMEQGKTIVLDEINLLPFDSLRFLQGIVDGKTEFYYKNRPVHIKDGFQIIGTMNLSLGGMVYGLPEPLVDRCSEAKEFVLSAEQLAKAIVGMEESEGE